METIKPAHVNGGVFWQALEKLTGGIPHILAWFSRFCSGLQPFVVNTGSEGPAALTVCGTADIEEAIWAPKYGLKGMIDASLDVAFEPATASQVPSPAF